MVNAHFVFVPTAKLAFAMLESVQMVYGNANVEAVEFVPGENAGDIVAKLEKLVSIHNQDEWLICRGIYSAGQPVECGSDACDAQSSFAGNQRPFSAAGASNWLITRTA